MSAEERERIKAERRAAREAGKSLKQPAAQPEANVENADAASSVGDAEPEEKNREG
jgi:hypothetical protein